MSLLDKGNYTVTVYPQEEYIDPDGNTILRAALTGYDTVAMIQAARQSGTSARRAEQDNEGYDTEELYRIRFTRKHDRENPPLGQAAEVLWRGYRWSVTGYETIYNGGRRTRHLDYQLKRT